MVYVHGTCTQTRDKIATITYSKWQQKRHSGKRRNLRIIYKFTFRLVRVKHNINSYMIFNMLHTLYLVI